MYLSLICRETFEQQRMDIRALQRELQANKKALEPKVSGSDNSLPIGDQLYITMISHIVYV